MVLLLYGDLSSDENDKLSENTLTWTGTVMSFSSFLPCISLYPSYSTNISIDIDRSNLTNNSSFSYKFAVVITFYCWKATILVWFFYGNSSNLSAFDKSISSSITWSVRYFYLKSNKYSLFPTFPSPDE